MRFSTFTDSAATSGQVSTVNKAVALRRFRAGISRMMTGGARVNIALLGDSVGEGWVTGNQQNFYYRMRDELLRQLGLTASQGYHRRASPNDLNSPKFSTGIDDNSLGFGHRSNKLLVGNSTGVLAANPTTGFTVNWRRYNGSIGDCSVIIDAGAPTTLTGALGSLPANQGYCGSTQYFPLASGAHTIQVDQAGGFAATLCSVYVHHGDENTICVWNGARSGWATSNYATEGEWADLLGTLQPELLIVELGINNWQGGTPDKIAAYRSGLVTAVTNARKASSRLTGLPGATCDPSIVFLMPWVTNNVSATTWSAFRGALYDAANTVGAWVFDWWNLCGDVWPTDPLALAADGSHPGTAGHHLIGTTLAHALLEVR